VSLGDWWRRLTAPAEPPQVTAPPKPPAPAVPHDAVVIPPVPAERKLGDRVLRLGVPRGPDVSWLQQRVGVSPVDGWYGPDEAKKEILAGVENYKRELNKA
jgi:hypothetical protein